MTRIGWMALGVALASPGCMPGLDAQRKTSPATTVRPSGDDRVACGAARDPLHPFIVQWPATNRADLQAAAERGPVIVRYADCELKVLAGCRAGGPAQYTLEAMAPAEDRFEIDDVRDLQAKLPLGVADLESRLREGKRLTLAYVTVGERVLDRPPVMLQGECAGATHYVGSMVLGAFGLTSRDARQTGASVQVLGSDARGEDRSSEQISGTSGDLPTCKDKGLAAGATCGAVLELGLRPLELVGGKLAAAGFGLGVGGPRRVPEVASLPMATPGVAFDQLDVGALELLQAATRADAQASWPGVAKAQAWERLARYAPGGAYGAIAERRRDQWQHEADAEKARRAQVVAMCPQYRADRAKLARLRALGDDVVGAAAKRAYERELADAYAAWPEVSRCPELETAAAADGAWLALHGSNDGMVHVPGTTFLVGSTEPGDSAAPVHSVTLGDFDIDVTEVTVEQYARCQRAHACTQRTSDEQDDTWRCNDTHQLAPYSQVGGERFDRSPANCATFEQAEAYCRFAKKRLPTEPEWELAARGTDGRTYPWGEWGNDGDGHPLFSIEYCPLEIRGYRVASIPANASAYGLRDMAGSVWEWTTGRFSAGYDRPPKGDERVLRGGYFGWSNTPDCKGYDAAYRLGLRPSHADSNTGIRCAR